MGEWQPITMSQIGARANAASNASPYGGGCCVHRVHLSQHCVECAAENSPAAQRDMQEVGG